MEFELTAVFEKVPAGYIAFVEEVPGAIQLVLEANRALTEESPCGETVIRERIVPA
jgi:hypothetical protein